MKLKIDPEFSKLIPDSGDDADLEREILADEGIFEPLVVWRHENILLDGHRRHRIHVKHPNLKMPKPIVLDIETRQEAHDWIIEHQLSKRNVTPEQRSYLIGKRYAKERPPRGGDQTAKVAVCSTAKKIAEKSGVSERTVHSAAAKAEALDAAAAVAGEIVKTKVLNSEVKATTADLKALAELPANTAKAVAREIRSGEVSTVKAAIEAVVPPEKKKPEAADEGGWEPHEAKRPLEKLKKSLAAACKAYDTTAKILGHPAALKTVLTHLEAASQSLYKFRESFKKKAG